MLYRYLWFISNVLFRIFFYYKVNGRAHLRKVKGAILAVNHTSFLDPIIAGSSSLRPIYYLARKDLFRNRFFGWLLRNINVIPFNRDAPDTIALKKAIQLLKNGKIVLIFPEGTRSPDGKLQKPHPGIGYIALKAGVPIVPMYIKGAYKILPRHRKFIRLSKIRVWIGEPIYLDTWQRKSQIERSDYEEVAGVAIERIKSLANLS